MTKKIAYNILNTNRVYQNLTIFSENYRTFPKVGPHYKEKACKFLARSDYS